MGGHDPEGAPSEEIETSGVNKESRLMRECQLKASQLGWRLFRNNVGSYRIGQRYIRYGVCNPGGSDLIGFTHEGRFVAIECKVNTPTTAAQMRFLQAVIKAGGIGIIAHSIDDIVI